VIIDVSRRAAQVLRFINDGRVRVRLEVLSPVAAKARFGSTWLLSRSGGESFDRPLKRAISSARCA
jgi:rare lipoprotein A (peptidoglycan hydrolase)